MMIGGLVVPVWERSWEWNGGVFGSAGFGWLYLPLGLAYYPAPSTATPSYRIYDHTLTDDWCWWFVDGADADIHSWKWEWRRLWFGKLPMVTY